MLHGIDPETEDGVTVMAATRLSGSGTAAAAAARWRRARTTCGAAAAARSTTSTAPPAPPWRPPSVRRPTPRRFACETGSDHREIHASGLVLDVRSCR